MADRLPPLARSKIMTYADAENSLMTSIRATQAQIKELGDAIAMTSEDARRFDLQEMIEQRRNVMEANRDKHRALAEINAKIKRHLDLIPADTLIEAAKPVKVKLKHDQSVQQAVVELRVQIMKLVSERAQVERVALPIEEQKAQIKKWIVEKGLRARPSIVANHERFSLTFDHKIEDAYTPTVDLLAWAAWYDPEYLEQKLIAQLEEMPQPKFAMTPLEKSNRLKEIKQALIDLERLECALVDAALDQGTIIEHRPNVSVDALLGLIVTKKSKATKAA